MVHVYFDSSCFSQYLAHKIVIFVSNSSNPIPTFAFMMRSDDDMDTASAMAMIGTISARDISHHLDRALEKRLKSDTS